MLLGLFLFLLVSAMARRCSKHLAQRHSLPFVWIQPHGQSPGLIRKNVFIAAVRKKALENGHAFALSACGCVLYLWGNG